jgi:hypothetical protein
MRFYTHRAGQPARITPKTKQRTHARHTHARSNPHPQPARGHPVTADHAPHPLTVDRSLSLSSIHFAYFSQIPFSFDPGLGDFSKATPAARG